LPKGFFANLINKSDLLKEKFAVFVFEVVGGDLLQLLLFLFLRLWWEQIVDRNPHRITNFVYVASVAAMAGD
jgi:hypothetical protein